MNKARAWIHIGLALLLMCLCVLSLPAPGMAHVVGGSSWSAPLPVVENHQVSSDLLTQEGQNVMLGLLDGSRDVVIPIDIPEDVYWYVTVSAEDTQNLWFSEQSGAEGTILQLEGVENTFFYQGGGEQSILLSLTNRLPVTYVAEGEEPPVMEEITTVVNVTLYYITAAEVATLQPANMVDVAEVQEIEETQTAEEMQPTEETTTGETAEDVQESEKSSVLKTISATFIVPLQESNTTAMLTGQLAQCPTQYHPTVAIPLLNGEADSELMLLNEDFPAMTRYTMGEETYLLYDGGTIKVPANTAIALDFSMVEEGIPEEFVSNEIVVEESTEVIEELTTEPIEEKTEEKTKESTEELTEEPAKQTLTLFAGGIEYSLVQAEAPTLDKTQAPFIMTGATFVLPMTYLWNDIAPTIAVEQLQANESTLVWSMMEAGRWKAEAAEDSLRLSSVGGMTEVGTYRLTATWAENEMTLYSLQTIFYVRSENL